MACFCCAALHMAHAQVSSHCSCSMFMLMRMRAQVLAAATAALNISVAQGAGGQSSSQPQLPAWLQGAPTSMSTDASLSLPLDDLPSGQKGVAGNSAPLTGRRGLGRRSLEDPIGSLLGSSTSGAANSLGRRGRPD